MIILAGSKGAVFLWDKEEWGSLGRFGWDDTSSFQVFFYECLACLRLLRIEGIYLSNFWNEARFQVDDMLVWVMRWKFVMGFLGKYIFEVFAPVW